MSALFKLKKAIEKKARKQALIDVYEAIEADRKQNAKQPFSPEVAARLGQSTRIQYLIADMMDETYV